MKSKVCFILVVLFVQLGFGQNSWTLDDCIRYALDKNLELRDFQYDRSAIEEDLKQSYRSFLPSVNGVSDFSIQYGRSINPTDNSYTNTNFFSNNYRIEASVDLFQGFKRLRTVEVSRFMLQASRNAELHQKYMLAFDVMSAYLDVLYFKELQLINEEQLKISSDNYRLVQKNVDLGLKAGADLFEAQSTLLSDSLALVQSMNSIREAQLKLRQVMNLPDDKNIALDAASVDKFLFTNIDLLNTSLDSVYENAVSFIPDIKFSEFQVAAAEKKVDVLKSELLPSASLFGGYGTGYYETFVDSEGKVLPFREQIDNNSKQLIGLAVNIPIYNSGTNRSNIEQSKIVVKQERNSLERKKQELKQIIQNLILDQKSLHEELKLSALNIKAQELAFFTAQKRYEKGLISILELYQAKGEFSQSMNEFLQLKFQNIVNKTTLSFYAGIPVFNDIIK